MRHLLFNEVISGKVFNNKIFVIIFRAIQRKYPDNTNYMYFSSDWLISFFIIENPEEQLSFVVQELAVNETHLPPLKAVIKKIIKTLSMFFIITAHIFDRWDTTILTYLHRFLFSRL